MRRLRNNRSSLTMQGYKQHHLHIIIYSALQIIFWSYNVLCG